VFNLAESFARAAGLILFLLAWRIGLADRVARLALRNFSHLAFWLAAIFFFAEALMCASSLPAAGTVGITKDGANLVCELTELLLNAYSPFKLIDGEVVYIHAGVNS